MTGYTSSWPWPQRRLTSLIVTYVGILAAMARTAASIRCGSDLSDSRDSPNAVEQAVDFDPSRERVVISELELGILARLRQSLEQPEPAGDLGQPAAAVVDPPRNDLKAQAGTRLDDQSQHGRRDQRAQRVDIVHEQPLEVGMLVQKLDEQAIAHQVRYFVKVPRGVESLDRHVVGIVGSFTLALGPAKDGAAAGVANLFLVVVERLVAGFFPEEASGRGPSESIVARSTGRARNRPGHRGHSCP